MHQTVVTLAADVQPRSVEALRACILKLKATVELPKGDAGQDGYKALGATVPSLHFASIMIFEDAHYDPLLTVELNIDGDIERFLPQLETAGLQPFLRTMVRCCKRPTDVKAATLYDSVTAPGSNVALAPFLLTRLVRPAVFHQGSRGLDRARILREETLFGEIQGRLASPALYQAADAVALHRGLRAAVLPANPWLDGPEAQRWTRGERVADWARLLGLVTLLIVCLSLPGMVLALLIGGWAAVALSLAAAFVLALMTPGVGETMIPGWGRASRPAPRPAPRRPGLPSVPRRSPEAWLMVAAIALAGLAAYLLLLALVFAVLLSPFRDEAFGALYEGSVRVVFTGLCTIALPVAIVLFALRWLEQRDPTQDEPRDDPEKLAAILASEDRIAQNHMGSLVLIKPGILRAIILRVGLGVLGLFLRVTRTDGYLGSMRTIHFAHWAIVSNGGRLVFFSNFDSSWESYLDDFIEKAHIGLTLAWTNGVGFAPTEFLINKGATSGRLFKAWARHSMAETLFWFSAYADLSVNQIERQYRIAEGLRRPSLSVEEAKQWACDL